MDHMTSNVYFPRPPQLSVEYERGSFSLKLLSTEEVNEVVGHIGNCMLRICPGLAPGSVLIINAC